jgi:hypothetical protein
MDKENIAPNMIRVPSMSMMPVNHPAERDWDDLDAEDAGDPLMVSEYVVEIFEYMRHLEVTFRSYANSVFRRTLCPK